MKLFLTLTAVFLVLFLVIIMGILMPRLSSRVLHRGVPTPQVSTLPTETTEQIDSEEDTQGKKTISIYLVALGDEGKSGRKIGCGDSVVAVTREIPATPSVLKSSLTDLLSLKEKYFGESGLYNALASSSLTLDRIDLRNETAAIYLTGSLSLGGVCDSPRVEEQLRSTALQFGSVKTVTFFLNSQPLHEVLSEK